MGRSTSTGQNRNSVTSLAETTVTHPCPRAILLAFLRPSNLGEPGQPSVSSPSPDLQSAGGHPDGTYCPEARAPSAQACGIDDLSRHSAVIQ
ncbi:hypothetical protein U0070_012451 [Myodes glareolus]|uniref:Uncharacterized protein n=1 Tax=Myodes glareolus TaxID=447135 RepID=A0AAW0HPH8_MYOGA